MAVPSEWTAGPPWRLRVCCNYRNWGWSEVYWLVHRHYPAVLTAAHDLCNRRRLWFSRGCKIIYAYLCRGESCRDTWALDLTGKDAFPSGNVAQPLPPNDKSSGWMYRCESADASYGYRLLRCVPDDWISDIRPSPAHPALAPNLFPPPPITLGSPLINGQFPLLLTGGQNLRGLQRSFLDSLVRNVGFLRKNGSSDENAWTVEPLVNAAYRQVGNSYSHHAWRRLSAIGLYRCINGKWFKQLFSFCGLVLGAARTSYCRYARWYVGGPYTGIRYYYPPPGNPLYLGRLRFGPKISEPGYHNAADTGEITTLGKRQYNKGTMWAPMPDGSAPEITADQAAGLEPFSFTL